MWEPLRCCRFLQWLYHPPEIIGFHVRFSISVLLYFSLGFGVTLPNAGVSSSGCDQVWLPMGLLVVETFAVALLPVYGYWSGRCGSSWCFLPLEAACFWTRSFLGGEPWFSQCLGVQHMLFWQLCFVVLQAVLSGALWGWCYLCVQVKFGTIGVQSWECFFVISSSLLCKVFMSEVMDTC